MSANSTESFNSNQIAKGIEGLAALAQPGMTSKEAVEIIKIRNNVAAVSNVGRIDIPEKFINFTMHSGRFGVSSPILSGRDGLFYVVVSTLHDRMQLEFIRSTPKRDDKYIVNFANRMRKILEASISNTNAFRESMLEQNGIK